MTRLTQLAQDMRIRITNVNGAATNYEIPLGILVSDVNGNGTVNASDVALDKSCSGFAIDQTNFRCDVNANCSLNAGDVALTSQEAATPWHAVAPRNALNG